MMVVADSLGLIQTKGKRENNPNPFNPHIQADKLHLHSSIGGRIHPSGHHHHHHHHLQLSSFVSLRIATKPFKIIYLELFLAPGSMPWKVVVVVMLSG